MKTDRGKSKDNSKSFTSNESHRRALVDRLVMALERELFNLSEEEFADLSSLEDSQFFAELAIRKLKTSALPRDRRALMQLEGIQRLNKLLESSGGLYTSERVCELLKTSPYSLQRDVWCKNIIQIERAGLRLYPVFQFENGKVLSSISGVILKLPDNITSAGVIRFFLTPVDLEGGQISTPIELLHLGKEAQVKSLAKEYCQQFCD